MTNALFKRISDQKISSPITFIIITVFIDSLGLAIIIPVLPELLQELTHESISNMSLYNGAMIFVYSLMQFIFAPILGALSDKYGRKPVLILSLGALGIDYIFMALAPTIWWFFLGRLIAGIMGASMTTASAYIADISTNKTRTRNFGLLEGAFGVGFILGPVIGGLVGQLGTRMPLFFAAALTLFNVAYGLIFVPETIKEKSREKINIKTFNPVGGLLYFSSNKRIMLMILIFFTVHLGVSSFHTIWVFYVVEKFDWGTDMIGYALGFFGFSMAITQAGMAKYVVRLLGSMKMLLWGLIITIASYTMFAFANRGWMMFAFTPLFELGWLSTTALMSLAAKEMPSSKQGKLQGIMTSMIGLTNILGPILMTGLFAFFTADNAWIKFPGAPFLLASILATAAFFMSIILGTRKELQPQETANNE